VGVAVFVGSVSSAVWAPPVLTVKPGAAWEVVEPVDADVVDLGTSVPVVDSCSAAVESGVVVVVVVP
jgi:hypothetical protein